MRAALVVALTGVLGAADPASGQEAAPGADPTTLSNAELIKAAPEAGQEWVWREERQASVENPVAAELRRRIVAGKLSDGDWRDLVIRTRAIYGRERWPAGVAYAIGLAYPSWLGDNGFMAITPRLRGAKQLKVEMLGDCALGNDSDREQRRYMEIGKVDGAPAQVELDVVVKGTPDQNKGGSHRWSGRVALPVEVVPTVEAALPGVHGEELDAAVQSWFSVMIGNQMQPPTTFMWVTVRPMAGVEVVHESVAFSFKVAVMDGQQVIESVSLDLERQPRSSGIMSSVVIRSLTPEQLRDPGLVDRLTLRITGDRDPAFRSLKRSRWWDGDLRVRVKDVLTRTPVDPKQR